jgi:hypothetical protein
MAQDRSDSMGQPQFPSLQVKAVDDERYSGLSRLEEIVYPELGKHLEGAPTADVNRLIQQYSVNQKSVGPEDVEEDFLHKGQRLAKKTTSKEPTPELVWSAGSHRGQPINEKELGALTTKQLAEEVLHQATDKAVWSLQVKHLMDMTNRTEKRKAEYRKTLEESKQTESRLRHQIEEMKEEMQQLQSQLHNQSTAPLAPIPQDTGLREQSVGTTGSTDGKRSPKHPDPPTLTDGADPTFKEWETGLKNKFLFNQDWFEDVQETRTHAKQVAYIQTTVKGKAFEHLDSFLDQHEPGQVITAEMCRKFLKQVFDDPDKRLKARTELNKLKLKYLGDFNDFYSEFVRLANVSKKPRGEWKEEIHDKLYEELQVHLEQHVMNESCDFDAYCQMARHFARGEERVGAKRKAYNDRKKQQSGKTTTKPAQTGANPTIRTQDPSTLFHCYNCGKKGHLKRDCPDKGETKAIDLDESSDELDSQDESGNE